MTANQSKDTVRFMGKSLLGHAREIYRYARNYCERSENNEYIDESSRAKYLDHCNRMLREMRSLMHMARSKGINGFCNAEQIDAYIEAARRIVSGSRTLRPADFSALLN